MKYFLCFVFVFYCFSVSFADEDCKKINEFINKYENLFHELGADGVRFKCFTDNGTKKLKVTGNVSSEEELEVLKVMMYTSNLLTEDPFDIIWSVSITKK